MNKTSFCNDAPIGYCKFGREHNDQRLEPKQQRVEQKKSRKAEHHC